MKLSLALTLLGVLMTGHAWALEKNHSHRWKNEDRHDKFKPLDLPPEEAKKVYENSLTALDGSITQNDTHGTRANAAQALSALETIMRSSNNEGEVETLRKSEKTLDSIRHSASKRDTQKAQRQFDSLPRAQKNEAE